MATPIQLATSDEIPDIVDFVKAARSDMFPMLDSASHAEQAQRLLASFQETYLDRSDGAFLTARTSEGRLIATIGYIAYDGRFPHLDIGVDRVAEVVRLFVDPAYRRDGLASKLVATLEQKARQAGIAKLYLHTHPFLPGAVRFWERQGFVLLGVDEDPVWNTTHLARSLE
ncbi:acyl-CoA N-acyltransferase [Dactylonectria estremocensis]|uniref:Acyl-CoA N-acyltransferase n=1 Tax=Dactylonectria estremocensis TaxID=1079267 RepID=A0A9P9DTB6_9HYPO|nr:acyl-CoA N-acyltransferase [Dactylonectria estremocensis]